MYIYQHLKLAEKRGLTKCTLINLGTINVICGKNNSGKSTVLAAISDDVQLEGMSSDRINVDDLYLKTLPNTGWSGNIDSFNRQYKVLLNEVISSRSIWYYDEGAELVSELKGQWRYFNNYGFPSSIESHFHGLFQKSVKIGLIPAKRRIESSVSFNSVGNARLDGVGILRSLFLLQTQPKNTTPRNTFDNIVSTFKDLTDGYYFNISLDGEKQELRLKFSGNEIDWFPADDCGLGLHEILIFLYFCIASDYAIVLIEEAENHLHPHIQRKFLHYLKTILDKQFFITTHSNIFLDTSVVDKVFYTENDGKIHIVEATNKATVLRGLGYSINENLLSDLVILVEGPTDKPVLEVFLKKMGLIPKYEIKMWALGGDIMHYHDLSVFKENHNVMALIDSDPGSKKVRDKFEQQCTDIGIPITKLKRRAIENYFSLNALRAVFKGQIKDDITELKSNSSLEDQIGINVKKNNEEIASLMEISEIEGTDMYDFLNLVKEKCEKSK